MQALSREARSNQRRLLTAFGIDTDSDLLKFNQLKVRPIYELLFSFKKDFCSFHIVDLKLLICRFELSGCGCFCIAFLTWKLVPFILLLFLIMS
jgi:hypothetical protein